ncbi:hypothetical protein ScPMuIL_016929 [Solemya velum]
MRLSAVPLPNTIIVPMLTKRHFVGYYLKQDESKVEEKENAKIEEKKEEDEGKVKVDDDGPVSQLVDLRHLLFRWCDRDQTNL